MKVVGLEFVRGRAKKNGQDSILRIIVGSLEQTLVLGWVQMCIAVEVFPLSGSPSVSCHIRNAQLYLDVFGMYSDFYEGNLRQESSTAFRGTMLVAGSCHTNARKRKLQTADANDPFRSYYSLCLSNAGKRRMVDSPRTMPVSSFQLGGRGHFEVFQKYRDLYATGAARNVQNMASNARASDDICSSVSNRRKRTAEKSHIMLTLVEATTSKRTIRFPTINSNMSAGHSSESQRVSRRVNAEGCSSAAAVGCSYTYADLSDYTQRCRYCGASFTNLVVW
nr:hypothetical protein [Tanacetum cinerariifolium]